MLGKIRFVWGYKPRKPRLHNIHVAEEYCLVCSCLYMSVNLLTVMFFDLCDHISPAKTVQ